MSNAVDMAAIISPALFFEIPGLTDNAVIQQELADNKDLRVTQKIQKGIANGFIDYLKYTPALAVSLALLALRSYGTEVKNGQEPVSQDPFLYDVVYVPILEEVVFRVIGQNALAVVQKIAKNNMPSSWRNNRVINYLTTASARVVTITTLFAATHFFGGGLPQVVSVFLRSPISLLYEITGDMIAPLSCHMTINCVARFVTNAMLFVNSYL